jgi:hypothetical protein
MEPLDWLVVATFLFVGYCASGLAGKHLHWLVNRRRVVHGDMVGGDVVGRYHNVGTINISGRSFSGNNITIINDRIYVDGKDITDDAGEGAKGIVKIEITGDVKLVNCDRSVSIKGNVNGDVKSGGSLNCDNITGNAESNGSMNAGNIGGNARSGGSMNCGKVSGSVTAGGSVRHG